MKEQRMWMGLYTGRWWCAGVEANWSDSEHDQLNVVRTIYRAPETAHWLRRPSQSSLPVTAALCVAVIHSAYVLHVRCGLL